MNKSRIKAFTIMEVTIAMLLAAIVIGITYTAFTIVNQSYLSFRTKNEAMGQLILLDILLKKDMAKADVITKTDHNIIFRNVTDSVKYEFQPKFIVRTSSIIDTFKVEAIELNASFEGSPLTSTNQAYEQNRLDDLGLVVLFENEKVPYHYHKDYSSANLIERNPNAVN